jgi:capsid assembly protease
MKHILSYLCNHPWAITERYMDTIQSVVDRETDLEAVAAKLGRPLANTSHRVEQRGSVAVISIEGPLFRYANLFTEISGATSVEVLATDFTAALDDDRVQSILLNVNSPGGQAEGVSELASMIYEARARKPIWAYVGGFAASGGYWLASAAERIVMHQTGYAGSIGVLATVTDDKERREKSGVRKWEIVSSQSPLKRVDPATDAGQAQLQEMVDEMAAIFIGQVAQHRATTAEHVTAHYGRGFVVSAQKSIAAGMADELGTYEGTLAKLNQAERKTFSLAAANVKEVQPMAEEKQPDVTAVRSEAVTAERARINAILNSEEAKGRETLARHLALETDMAPEAARKALAASAPATPAAPLAPPKPDAFTQQMRAVPNPQVGVEQEGAQDDVAAEIRSISAFIPPNQRRKPA